MVVQPQSSATAERRLLLVEDEVIIARDLRASLEELGYAVVGTAANSEQAIRLAEQTEPDLVLMDIRLKGPVDGIETAAILQRRRPVAVVYLTANMDDATLSRALETDPSGYLAKPFTPQALRSTIEVALRKQMTQSALHLRSLRERGGLLRQSEELQALVDRFREEAFTDPLTRLSNRRHFESMLLEQIRNGVRDGAPVSLILLDLDHFKAINDTHGHPAADGVLRAVADVLRGRLRAGDGASRYGGEEFAVILPGATHRDALSIAEHLRAAIQALHVDAAGSRIAVTASFGVSTFPLHGQTAERLVGAADHALYQAKRAGRNRVIAAGG